MAKIKIDDALYKRAKTAAKTAGYSSVEEMVTYLLEMELDKLESSPEQSAVEERLRGLGYME